MMQPPPNADGTWYIRWATRALGVIGGVLYLIYGLWSMISFSSWCIAKGLFMMVFGFVLLALEAPFCCMWFDFVERMNEFSENRPKWMKAALYCAFGIIPMVMCWGIMTFLFCAIVFAAGLGYGYQTLGQKADRQTMMAAASSQQNITSPQADNAWDSHVDQKPYP